MKRRRTAIFGGSFDPIHTGHLLIADAAVRQFGISKLIVVPARQSPHKSSATHAGPKHRMAMIRAAIRERRHCEASDVEIRSSGVSYTIDTLRHMRDEYPLDDLYLLIGSDHLEVFRTWKEPDTISRLARIIVYTRWGHTVRSRDLKRWRARLLTGPEIFISSTDVRRRCLQGRPIRYFVPRPVERYIHRHRLYTHPTRGR